MKISFYGGAGEVTGSNHLLEVGSCKIMIDCGLFQGGHLLNRQNYVDFPYDPKAIDVFVLTHAHLDHCGRIPKLVKQGFNGKIIATQATKELAEIVMLDTAGIMQDEVENKHSPVEEALFDEADVMRALSLFDTHAYDEPIMLKDARIILKDAGHILGSSFVEITTAEGTVTFSGDLGKKSVPIMNDPAKLSAVDYLVTEATYGDRLHRPTKTREEYLQEAIDYVKQSKGTLMIPTFALERTQEILFTLNSMFLEHKISDIPVFLDSPMAIEVTKVFKKYERLFDEEAKEDLAHDKDIFDFHGLKMTDSREQSRQINQMPGAKVILAGSGMMHGGRIMHHLKRYLSDEASYLLVVGYQVEGTLGREIIDGAKRVKIFDEWVNVRAKVVNSDAFSAHADRKQLCEWIAPAYKSLKQIFLVHTEADNTVPLVKDLREATKANIVQPTIGDQIELIK